MLLILVELEPVKFFTEVVHGAVDPRTDITRLPVILEHFSKLALLASYRGSHNNKSRSLRIELKLIDYLVDGL